jgi:hypothetical protein
VPVSAVRERPLEPEITFSWRQLGGRGACDLAEVDLRLLAQRRIVHEHGRAALVPAGLVVCVPA